VDETVARFEFRTFAPHMGTTEQRVRALSPCDSISESREIYLLDCENALENNVKIRDGRLDLKRLVERRQGLERWKPAGRWDFPLSLDTIRKLWPKAMLQRNLGLSSGITRAELLQAAAELCSGLHRVNIFKRRFRFSLMNCDAELDRLIINGAELESFAAESEDPQAVLEVVAALRIEDFENQCYPLILCRLLGRLPMPDEKDYGT
jgi:hypothetical protein